MALPLSGQLSISQIRTELGIPSQAPFSLDTATNGGYVTLNPCSPYLPNPGNPDSISEWYGYNHTINCCGGNPCYLHTGWSFAGDCTTACAGPFTFSFYSCCSTISTLCAMNGASNCSGYYPPLSGYLSNGSVCYTVNGNQIESVVNCAATTTSTTTTAAPGNCHDYQATASSFISYTDCCGNPQNYYILVGDTFCAQIGTVSGYYIDLGTNCNC